MGDPGGTTQRFGTALIAAALVLTATGCSAASTSPTASHLISESSRPSLTPQATASPVPAWTATGNLIEARWAHTATLLSDGRVLVAGGNIYPGGDSPDPATDNLASAEIYDPHTGSWTATGTLSEARGYGQTATLLRDGKVLVAGGAGLPPNIALASAELYDPATGTWTATGSMGAGRLGQTATLLPDGRVLVAGGFGGDPYAPRASAEVYDPGTGSWSATGSMPSVRIGHTATLLLNGRVLVTGGMDNDGSSPIATAGDTLSSAELYDPETGTWTATGSMTAGRRGQTAALLPDGSVLVAGGVGLGTEAVPYPIVTPAELYDPDTGTWIATDGMIVGRAGHTATSLPDGRVLVAGGSSVVGLVAEAELYDPASGSWTAAETMIDARNSYTATLLSDGRVLVAGGGDFFPTAAAEIYTRP